VFEDEESQNYTDFVVSCSCTSNCSNTSCLEEHLDEVLSMNYHNGLYTFSNTTEVIECNEVCQHIVFLISLALTMGRNVVATQKHAVTGLLKSQEPSLWKSSRLKSVDGV
jgi:hypothetical protein